MNHTGCVGLCIGTDVIEYIGSIVRCGYIGLCRYRLYGTVTIHGHVSVRTAPRGAQMYTGYAMSSAAIQTHSPSQTHSPIHDVLLLPIHNPRDTMPKIENRVPAASACSLKYTRHRPPAKCRKSKTHTTHTKRIQHQIIREIKNQTE